jgi:hypothetical protein
MRSAFKEWAIVVDALATGAQIIILRKGGISEGVGGFKMEHPEFLLFPTLFHQQRESVLPAAQARYDQIQETFPPSDQLRIEYFCRVIEWRQLNDAAAAARLEAQHIWRPEVIAERFDWGRSKSIFALAVRTFRLPREYNLPMLPAYGGCKSWIELDQEIPTEDARPVLDDATFAERLHAFQTALG